MEYPYDHPMGIFEGMDDDDPIETPHLFDELLGNKPVVVIQVESKDPKLLVALMKFLGDFKADKPENTLIRILENKEKLGDEGNAGPDVCKEVEKETGTNQKHTSEG